MNKKEVTWCCFMPVEKLGWDRKGRGEKMGRLRGIEAIEGVVLLHMG